MTWSRVLSLAAPAGRDDAAPDDPEPQAGHGHLPDDDDAGHPPWQRAQVRQGDQSGPGQRLVGNRIGDLAEVSDEAPPPGQLAIEQVSHRGERKGHERDRPVASTARQQEPHEDWHQGQAEHRQAVGHVDHARRWRRVPDSELIIRRRRRVLLRPAVPVLAGPGSCRAQRAPEALSPAATTASVSASRSTPSLPVTTAATTSPGASCRSLRTSVAPSTSGAWCSARPR